GPCDVRNGVNRSDLCEGCVLSDRQATGTPPPAHPFLTYVLFKERRSSPPGPFRVSRPGCRRARAGCIRPCQNRVNTPYEKTFPQRVGTERPDSRPFPVAIAGGLWLESDPIDGERRAALQAAVALLKSPLRQLRHPATHVRTNPRMAFPDPAPWPRIRVAAALLAAALFTLPAAAQEAAPAPAAPAVASPTPTQAVPATPENPAP